MNDFLRWLEEELEIARENKHWGLMNDGEVPDPTQGRAHLVWLINDGKVQAFEEAIEKYKECRTIEILLSEDVSD